MVASCKMHGDAEETMRDQASNVGLLKKSTSTNQEQQSDTPCMRL